MKHTQEELEAIVTEQNAGRQLKIEMAAIREGYTQEEIDTFPVQEAEAAAWQANNNAATPMIDGIIAENGRGKADQVARILGKATIYKDAVGRAIGRKQKKER